ncbi:hypothetical protein IPdc08_01362 [archaeon]|nr:hypothetical protein IPdc08_01362 [archaeon]
MGIGHHFNGLHERLIKLNPALSIWNRYDILFVFIAPVIQGLIYGILLIAPYFHLSYSIKHFFILYLSNPTFSTRFLSNYTSIRPYHLISDIFIYIIIIFLLFNVERNKKRFYCVSAFLLLVLPLIASEVTIKFMAGEIGTSLGFSAIVAGFMGYLLYDVYAYVRDVYKIPVGVSFIFIFFFIDFTFWSVTLSTTLIHKMFVTIAVTGVGVLVYINWKTINKIYNTLIAKSKNLTVKDRPYWVVIFLGMIYFSIFYFYFFKPAQLHIGHAIINWKVHYVGYFFGLVISWVINRTLQFHQSGKKLSWRISR